MPIRIKLDPVVDLSPDFLLRAIKEETDSFKSIVEVFDDTIKEFETDLATTWDDWISIQNETLTKTVTWEKL